MLGFSMWRFLDGECEYAALQTLHKGYMDGRGWGQRRDEGKEGRLLTDLSGWQRLWQKQNSVNYRLNSG